MPDFEHMDSGILACDQYQGLPGRTRQSIIHYSCMSCGCLFTAHVHAAINLATDPEFGEQLARGELNLLCCPACHAAASPSVSLVYHDPGKRHFLLVIPDALRHQELELRIALLQELAADEAHVPDYVRAVQVVFGEAGLQRALEAEERSRCLRMDTVREEARRQEADHRQRAELDRREEELIAREEDLSARDEDRLAVQAQMERERRELDQRRADLERERDALRALALDLEARERALRQRKDVPPPLPAEREPQPAVAPSEASTVRPVRPQSEIDRWRTGEGKVGQLVHLGRLYLLARPGAELLPALQKAEPTLLLQQRVLQGGPLISLCLRPAPEEVLEQPSRADRALFWCFDPARSEDAGLLALLAESFRVEVELYDDEARPVAVMELQAPLEENVRWALARCAAEPIEGRDFAEACRAFEALGGERLGRKQHNFTADSFVDMVSPASVRLALGIVAYWSQPENYHYLIGVKSFPLIHWRAIRERVVRRALEYGLRLSSELAQLALELKLAESHQTLLRTMVANFAEVSLRIKPSDLDPAQECDNWKLLLADCVQAQVPIDKEIEDLASASARRAGGHEDETSPGGDLSLLPLETLMSLLEQRDQRRDAALELCERAATSVMEPLFVATCAMTRVEVARIMPALVSFGSPLVPLLVQGLKHRKSFIRQGCALCLGALRAQSAAEPLLDMLLAEPTTVWREAARALGDLGLGAMEVLVQAAKSADPANRERLAWAMAHLAFSAVAREQLETISRGEGSEARVAAAALEVIGQARQADQEVRGTSPLREQTIVRSFTYQFFQGVTRTADELGENDIVEQEEVLDDRDIVDEEVEVEDEDILNR